MFIRRTDESIRFLVLYKLDCLIPKGKYKLRPHLICISLDWHGQKDISCNKEIATELNSL